MKHKEKRLEYARRYQTMSTKEWRNVVFSEEKKFNLIGPDGFQKYWHARHIGGVSLIIWKAFSASEKLKVQFVSCQRKAADYVKMLNDVSLAQEGHRLFGEKNIF